jgi:xylose isomerase
MDSFAKGLKIAHKLLEDGKIEDFIAKRYQIESFKIGEQIIYGFEVLSIENMRGQGLLGMDFLSRFKFNINQQTDELELSTK